MVTPADLYGKNLGFPPRVGANGQMAWTEGEMSVREFDSHHPAHTSR